MYESLRTTYQNLTTNLMVKGFGCGLLVLWNGEEVERWRYCGVNGGVICGVGGGYKDFWKL